MPSLGETYTRSSGGGDRRLLVFAVGVLGGAVIGGLILSRALEAGLSAMGFEGGAAAIGGTALTALAVPFAGAGLLRWTRSPRRARSAGATGVVLATVAVAAYIVSTPADGGLGSVPAAVLVTYAVGALLALASPVLASATTESRPTHTRPQTSFVRNRRSIGSGNRTPADGGTEEQEVAFLLDTDDK